MPKFAKIPTRKTVRRFLRPGDFIEVVFKPVRIPQDHTITARADGQQGKQLLSIEKRSGVVFTSAKEQPGLQLHPDWINLDRPFDDLPVSPELPEIFGLRDIKIELFQPNSSEPIASFIPKGQVKQGVLEFDLKEVDQSLMGERWKCRFTNVGDTPARCIGSVEFTERLGEMTTTAIPFDLINHAARIFLATLRFRLEVDDDKGVIEVSNEINRLSGGRIKSLVFDADSSVPIYLAEDIPVIGAAGKYIPVINLIPPIEVDVDINHLELKRMSIEATKNTRGWPIIRMTAFLSDFDIDVGKLIQISDPDVTGGEITINLLLFGSKPVEIAEHLGYIVEVDLSKIKVDTKETEVKAAIRRKVGEVLYNPTVYSAISEFLKEGFIQLAQRGHKFFDITADNKNFLIIHYPPKREVSIGPEDPAFEPGTPIDPSSLNQTSLENLDKIDHIVFLMMENRSFDHMLGYLRLQGKEQRLDLDGLTGTETNPTQGPAVGLSALEDTLFEFDPDHSFDGVQQQINHGNMSGFVENFRDRYPFLNPDGPETIMSFYTAEQLPTYDFLVKHFLVCDRWFCSHPGSTQPNRFCTLSGRTPILDNVEITDPRLSYFKTPTIFDTLTDLKISWTYYESDVAFLRMFDRYRLDNTHVIRLHDEAKGFFVRAKEGKLPSVTFIDPNFEDVPPERRSNDDHPPSDVANGQEFIRRVYNALRNSPNWNKTLFVITYDEHGGFYDHVPPPGTKIWKSDPQNKQFEVAKVHPEAPAFFGVRVPTFVISPWVPKGSVSSTIFDHTSIIKTIILKFRKHSFPDFGPRVAQIEHLGTLLTRKEPRLNIPEIQPIFDKSKKKSKGRLHFQSDKQDTRDFHEAMRNFGKPLQFAAP